MEKISFMSAAQRRGCSVADIEKLVKDGELEEVERGKVDKNALLALAGLSGTGNQTKGEKKKTEFSSDIETVTKEEAAKRIGKAMGTLYYYLDQGKIESVGKEVSVASIDAFLKEKGKKRAPGTKKTTAKVKEEEKGTDDNKVLEKKKKPIPEVSKSYTPPGQGVVEEKVDEDTIPLNEEKSEAGEEAFDLDAVMKELFPGMKMISVAMRDAALKAPRCRQCMYTKKEMVEVADMAYVKGKLAVYESMGEFKRVAR